MKPSRELRNVVLGFFRDFGAVDDAAIDVFSQADTTVLIGSDPGEFVAGGPQVRALMRRQFEQVRQIGPLKVEPGAIHAFEEGTFGWAASECLVGIEGGPAFTMRFTHVFHREHGEWMVAHAHASVPRPNVDTIGIELTTSIEEIADLVDRERPDLTPVASPEGTLTIMFTDMEASTATNETLGDDRFLPVLLRHNEIIQERTHSAGGTVVKSQGDGFMLAFPSAHRGVECAVAVQQAVATLDERIRVRMGLHTGEPVRHSDDFYGRDVAYAARIGSAATGGEILVSSLVKALVEPSGSVAFEGPREVELKGFDGPQPVYAVKW